MGNIFNKNIIKIKFSDRETFNKFEGEDSSFDISFSDMVFLYDTEICLDKDIKKLKSLGLKLYEDFEVLFDE